LKEQAMHRGRTTLSKFLIENLQENHLRLAGLLVDVAAAIKAVASMTGKDGLEEGPPGKLEAQADEEMVRSCEWSGLLAGLASRRADQPHPIPSQYKRGRYLLLFDPLAGAANLDLNVSVGTLFSVITHRGTRAPGAADYLKPGREQVAAGYAIYGPATMLVLTIGRGTHVFTLDREVGNFILTHPALRIPEDASAFAINTGNERFWEPPVQRYVAECRAGVTGARARDFTMRWIASMTADVHRILMRGGVFILPRDGKDAGRPGRVQLLFEANPIALLVEQAGGVASTGRERVLDVVPGQLHEHVPLILGSRNEVERIERYHREYDDGTDKPYASPLFNERSLFRDAGNKQHH
jgi:fructose-1,6-bisphosphatase I / sedoheptulose-1,7-bisphosphatase